ncbi:MAG: hypothetical protein N0A24_05615 [Armatimonadetes bacterium]|nr:hypothetical protein [Armatimonadota bacterium]MDW8153682.1 hypothetical protein [Armatimonadota bacterium]
MSSILLLTLGLSTAAVANRFRMDARLVVGFGIGAGLFLVLSGASRGVTFLASVVWRGPDALASWVFVVLNGLLAQLFQTTAALVLGGSRSGGGALQLAELGLPDGLEVRPAVLASLGRLVAGSAVTGLGVGLVAEGRWAGGVALITGGRVALDLGPHLLQGPDRIAGITWLWAVVLTGWLVVRIRSGPPRGPR